MTNTSKKDEALKLALEALLSCSAGDYSTGHVIHPSFDVDAVDKAIEAIDALAEQPAQQRSLSDMKFGGCPFCGSQACVAGQCQRPAQQRVEELLDTFKDVDQCGPLLGMGQPAQQEPVAYGMWDTMIGKDHRMMMVRLDKGQDGCTVPLYTSPQPAQQQEPVTDEENEKFSRDVSNFKGADPEATKYALEEFLKNRASPQPSKPWVGLTDEEIISMSRYDLEYAALIGEVQRKLKEKNCG